MSDDIGGKRLGNLASITAAIEATRTEIRSVQVRTGTETYEARVELSIPLNRVNSLGGAYVETDHAEFVDNELRVELEIEIVDGDQSGPETSRSASDGHPRAEDRSDNSNELGGRSGLRSHPPPQLEGDEKQEDGNTETPSTVETKSESGSEPDSQKSNSTDTQEVPKYQDPELLAAVYEEDATFEEMRRELGVDVTAQTVRKYMIKHGIHEPEPRPDRLLEAIRAAEFELMSSEEDRRPGQTGDSASTTEDQQ